MFHLDSKLNFGRHRGMTVREVLALDDGATYLEWCNENLKWVRFTIETGKAIEKEIPTSIYKQTWQGSIYWDENNKGWF